MPSTTTFCFVLLCINAKVLQILCSLKRLNLKLKTRFCLIISKMCQILNWKIYSTSDFDWEVPQRSEFQENVSYNKSVFDCFHSVEVTDSEILVGFQKNWFWFLKMITCQNLSETTYNPSDFDWESSEQSELEENFALNRSTLDCFHSRKVTDLEFFVLFQKAWSWI